MTESTCYFEKLKLFLYLFLCVILILILIILNRTTAFSSPSSLYTTSTKAISPSFLSSSNNISTIKNHNQLATIASKYNIPNNYNNTVRSSPSTPSSFSVTSLNQRISKPSLSIPNSPNRFSSSVSSTVAGIPLLTLASLNTEERKNDKTNLYDNIINRIQDGANTTKLSQYARSNVDKADQLDNFSTKSFSSPKSKEGKLLQNMADKYSTVNIKTTGEVLESAGLDSGNKGKPKRDDIDLDGEDELLAKLLKMLQKKKKKGKGKQKANSQNTRNTRKSKKKTITSTVPSHVVPANKKSKIKITGNNASKKAQQKLEQVRKDMLITKMMELLSYDSQRMDTMEDLFVKTKKHLYGIDLQAATRSSNLRSPKVISQAERTGAGDSRDLILGIDYPCGILEDKLIHKKELAKLIKQEEDFFKRRINIANQRRDLILKRAQKLLQADDEGLDLYTHGTTETSRQNNKNGSDLWDQEKFQSSSNRLVNRDRAEYDDESNNGNLHAKESLSLRNNVLDEYGIGAPGLDRQELLWAIRGGASGRADELRYPIGISRLTSKDNNNRKQSNSYSLIKARSKSASSSVTAREAIAATKKKSKSISKVPFAGYFNTKTFHRVGNDDTKSKGGMLIHNTYAPESTILKRKLLLKRKKAKEKLKEELNLGRGVIDIDVASSSSIPISTDDNVVPYHEVINIGTRAKCPTHLLQNPISRYDHVKSKLWWVEEEAADISDWNNMSDVDRYVANLKARNNKIREKVENQFNAGKNTTASISAKGTLSPKPPTLATRAGLKRKDPLQSQPEMITTLRDGNQEDDRFITRRSGVRFNDVLHPYTSLGDSKKSSINQGTLEVEDAYRLETNDLQSDRRYRSLYIDSNTPYTPPYAYNYASTY